MPDPLTTAYITSLAVTLAAEATKWLMAQANETSLARQIRQQVGLGKIHPKAQKAFRGAIEEASRELPHLNGDLVEAFLDAGDNRRIIAQWIWEPGRSEMQKGRLDRSAAVKLQEKANLDHFIDRLPEALERHAREVFEDEAWFVIERVSDKINRDGEKTRSTVESAREDLTEGQENLAARFDRMERLLTQMDASRGASNREAIESSLLDDLDEVKRLIGSNGIEQAIRLGQRTLEKIENEDLGREARRTAHEHLANAFLSTLDRREEAIPHVNALAALAEASGDRLRNQALEAHLRGDAERGLELIEEALTEDPGDRASQLVKAHLLADAGDTEAASDLYAEHVDQDSPGDLHNLGQLEIRAGRFENARGRALAGLDLAPTDPGLHLLFGMAVILGRNAAIERGEGALPEEALQRIREARDHLNRAIEGYEHNRSRQAGACFYRGVTDLWLGDHEKAERVFEQAARLMPADGPTLHNLTILALDREDANAARGYLSRLKASGHHVGRAEMLRMESQILKLEGRSDKRISLLKEAAEEAAEEAPQGEGGVAVRLMLAGAYRDDLDTEGFERTLNELRQEAPEDPRLLIKEALLAREERAYDEAVEKLCKARDASEGKRAAIAEALLADTLYTRAEEAGPPGEEAGRAQSDYEAALALYRRRLYGHDPEEAVAREAMCLLRLKRYPECIELCEEELDKAPRPELKVKLTKIKARIYEIHEDYAKAAPLYKEIALQSGGDVDALLRCSQCYVLVGESDRARGAVEMVAGKIDSKTPEAQEIISRAYLVSGQMKKAVHHAHLAQKHGEGERRYIDYYISLFFFYSAEIERAGAAKRKHHETVRRLIAEYPERFPDSQFIQRFEVPEDPEELREQLLKQLPSADEIRSKHELLSEGQLPIGAAAKLLGRSVPETWAALIGAPEYEIAANDGNRKMLEQEVKAAASAEAVILDVVPLLTLSELGLLDAFAEAFEEIYVPQVAFSELQQAIDKERAGEGQERKYVQAVGEEARDVALTTIPAEEADAFLARLRRVRTFIRETDHVKPKGITPGRDALSRTEASDGAKAPRGAEKAGAEHRDGEAGDEAPSEKEPGDPNDEAPSDKAPGDEEETETAASKLEWDYEEVLGRPAAEAILEAPLLGVTLYAEDAMVRRFARTEGAEAFGTRALLRALHAKGVLSDHTFFVASIRLNEMGYGFPFVNLETLAYAIAREKGPTPLARAALGSLADPRCNPTSAFQMGTWLIFWIWATHIKPSRYKEFLYVDSVLWTWRTLNAVARGKRRRGLSGAMIKVFQKSKGVALHAIGPVRYQVMLAAIAGWTKFCRSQKD